MIDLLEGNFASDINNISYTPTQKSMKKCIEDEGKVVVRWMEYIESENPYEEGKWIIKKYEQTIVQFGNSITAWNLRHIVIELEPACKS